jgi:hypothetical protein
MSLRRLRNLPGNLAVKPHSVIRNLFEEIGWHQDLAADGMVRDEVTQLRRLVARWSDLEPTPTRPPSRSWRQRLASRFGRNTRAPQRAGPAAATA